MRRGNGGRIGGTGLLLLGGGARAAYSVGFLRCLARRLPGRCESTAIAGVSSGAINAAFLASRPGSFQERVDALAELWEGIEPSSVMEVGTLDLLRKIVGWGAQLIGGGSSWIPAPRALIDCRPLLALLRRELAADEDDLIRGIGNRLEEGRLRSLLVATTSYTTGESVVWSQGASLPPYWSRPGRRTESTDLTVQHVLASASLPLLFPAVELNGEWHGDGEVRLDSPLSALVALGVDRILAVSTHHGQVAERPEGFSRAYPPPGQVAGAVVNAAFLHHLSGDVRRLRRVNHLIRSCGDGGGAEQESHFREVGLHVHRPSCDLEALAGERESGLPGPLRWMIRGLGTHATASPGLLSLMSFQPKYVRDLIRRGEKEAESRGEAIESFMAEDSPATATKALVDDLRLR